MKYGLGGLNSRFNSTSNNNFNTDLSRNIDNLILVGRVKSVLFDKSHYRYKELGEDNAIGTIEYDYAESPSNLTSFFPIARPLFSNISNYPLINEIVYILVLPSKESNKNLSSKEAYYLSTISSWSHPHCNPLPFKINPNNNKPISSKKNYLQTQLGSINKITDQLYGVKLGDTFKERSNIHPLLPFEGDIIYEGRWGNSIRFGSTVQNRPNNWSTTGKDGDPILILRNGQLIDASDEGWIPIVEDINGDISSIYLTSTQTVPIEVSSPDYYSYESAPIIPNEYQGKQIILNSGRLLFNSNLDHILLSSQKSIGLSAIDSVNIDTKKVVIQSNKLYLGSKNANEPLLLGGSTILLLKQLIDALNSFMNIASTTVSTAPGTPLGPLNVIASQTAGLLQLISTQLDSLKSKDNFTI